MKVICPLLVFSDSTGSASIFPELPIEVELQVDTVVLARVKSKTWYRGKVVETQTEGMFFFLNVGKHYHCADQNKVIYRGLE